MCKCAHPIASQMYDECRNTLVTAAVILSRREKFLSTREISLRLRASIFQTRYASKVNLINHLQRVHTPRDIQRRRRFDVGRGIGFRAQKSKIFFTWCMYYVTGDFASCFREGVHVPRLDTPDRATPRIKREREREREKHEILFNREKLSHRVPSESS